MHLPSEENSERTCHLSRAATCACHLRRAANAGGSATRLGEELGIEVAAGHGLTHLNLGALVEAVPSIVEYNIGHSIISRAVFVGLDTAVRDLVRIIR